ncbi:MAG: OpgC domain-containing protein [Candidatus Kaistia colombiensis]|nr:MAG: OpgC domain-containing protein [Kaistia sp.]
MIAPFGQRFNTPAQYALTCLFALPCFALRLQWPWHSFSYFLFAPAVLLGAALFGRGPAILATVLTAVFAVFFWIEPIYTFRLSSQQVPPLVLYALVCASVVGLCEWSRAALNRDRRALLAETRAQAGARLDGIDFWRGLVLCTILINHVPGNILEAITHRNFGVSDSAEAFVFLSGVSLALAYGHRFRPGERVGVLVAMLRRVLKLYGVHVALSFAAIAIFSAGALYWRQPELLMSHGRSLYVKDAWTCLIGIVSLGHQLGYFNILPLYMALILAVPVLLWLARIDVSLMLIASAVLYAVTRYTGWNLPNWPAEGGWFLNPFAWQFVMAIGLAAGLALKQRGEIPVTRPMVALAAIVVGIGFLMSPYGPAAARDWIGAHGHLDTDKSVLGLTRLSHFLALAYLVYALRLSAFCRRLPVFAPLATIGRHGLLIFALLSVLSALGQVLVGTVRTSAWFDIGFLGGGLVLLWVVAHLADAARPPRRGRPLAQPALAA